MGYPSRAAVALLTEGVDRNKLPSVLYADVIQVALLTEGVDRNIIQIGHMVPPRVALLTEGVDRNKLKTNNKTIAGLSPSSRRAWIEIRR